MYFVSSYRYVQLEELGNGTYGSVLLGQRVDTGEKVRIFFLVLKKLSRGRVIVGAATLTL